MNNIMSKHLSAACLLLALVSVGLVLAACASPRLTQLEPMLPKPTQPQPQDPSGIPGPRVHSLTKAVPAPPDPQGFSFLVGGHLYGNPGSLSGVPSTTLLAQVHAIRNGPEKFLVSTGDFIRGFEPPVVVPTFELFQFLEKPVFNAPGNHDYVPDKYEQLFGPSFGSFEYGNALFVLLNTERQPWHLERAQVDMVQATADWVLRQSHIDHVFYFAHKVVFAVDEPRYASLLRNCNGRDGLDDNCNFSSDVLPTLRRVAKDKRVLWFCGDLGVSWSFSLFYDEHPDYGVTFLGSGLGSTESDCLLRIGVAGKTLDINPVPMHAGAMIKNGLRIDSDVATYGPEYWDRHFAKRAQERLPRIGGGK